MSQIEQRVARLETIEAIRRLKIRYCELCDDNYDPDGLAALFTEDGIWDGGRNGRAEGREQIRNLWAETAKVASFAVHYITNHIVDLGEDDESASGRCSLWEPITLNGEAMWASVIYDEKYTKVDGVWRFREMVLNNMFCTPYSAGWEAQRFA